MCVEFADWIKKFDKELLRLTAQYFPDYRIWVDICNCYALVERRIYESFNMESGENVKKRIGMAEDWFDANECLAACVIRVVYPRLVEDIISNKEPFEKGVSFRELIATYVYSDESDLVALSDENIDQLALWPNYICDCVLRKYFSARYPLYLIDWEGDLTPCAWLVMEPTSKYVDPVYAGEMVESSDECKEDVWDIPLSETDIQSIKFYYGFALELGHQVAANADLIKSLSHDDVYKSVVIRVLNHFLVKEIDDFKEQLKPLADDLHALKDIDDRLVGMARQGKWFKRLKSIFPELDDDVQESVVTQFHEQIPGWSIEKIESSLIDFNVMRDHSSFIYGQGDGEMEYSEVGRKKSIIRVLLKALSPLHSSIKEKYVRQLCGDAVNLRNAGLFSKSEDLFTKCLDCLSINFEEKKRIWNVMVNKGDFPVAAWVLNNYGVLLRRKGEFKKAESVLKKAKAIRNELKVDHGEQGQLDYAWSCNDLGVLYRDIGNYELAKEEFVEAEGIYRKLCSKGNKQYMLKLAWTLNDLGVTYCLSGENNDAKEALDEALKLRENGGDSHSNIVWTKYNLGMVYLRYADSLETVSRVGFELSELKNRNTGKIIDKMRDARDSQFKYLRDAESVLREALEEREAIDLRSSNIYAGSFVQPFILNALGAVYATSLISGSCYRIDSARDYFEKAHRLRSLIVESDIRAYGPLDAQILHNLGLIYANDRPYLAVKRFQESLALYNQFEDTDQYRKERDSVRADVKRCIK